MTTKAKPVKAKALPKRLRAQLEATAALRDTKGIIPMSPETARAILAALRHEREAGLPSGYHVHLSAPAGCAIEDAAVVLCDVAKARRQFVHMTHNGVELTAHEGTTPGEVVDAFYSKVRR